MTALTSALGDQYSKKNYCRTVRLVNVIVGKSSKNKGFRGNDCE